MADGSERDVPLATVGVGDHLRVRPGEKVPVDGTVDEGRPTSTIDADRRADAGGQTRGDTIIGATLNTTGSLVIRADQVGSGTVLAQTASPRGCSRRRTCPAEM